MFIISGMEEPTADKVNSKAAKTNPFFLPISLDIKPPKAPPMIQPMRALDTVNPLSEFNVASSKTGAPLKFEEIMKVTITADNTLIKIPIPLPNNLMSTPPTEIITI